MPPNAATPKYTISYQQPKTALGGDGKAVDGIEVGFVTAAGDHGHVFIPRNRFNPDTVKAAVNEHVDTLNAVRGLSS
jgi:hypothetical protein